MVSRGRSSSLGEMAGERPDGMGNHERPQTGPPAQALETVLGRIAHQREIDASIALRPNSEYLYDQAYDDKSRSASQALHREESLSLYLAVDWT